MSAWALMASVAGARATMTLCTSHASSEMQRQCVSLQRVASSSPSAAATTRRPPTNCKYAALLCIYVEACAYKSGKLDSPRRSWCVRSQLFRQNCLTRHDVKLCFITVLNKYKVSLYSLYTNASISVTQVAILILSPSMTIGLMNGHAMSWRIEGSKV